MMVTIKWTKRMDTNARDPQKNEKKTGRKTYRKNDEEINISSTVSGFFSKRDEKETVNDAVHRDQLKKK